MVLRDVRGNYTGGLKVNKEDEKDMKYNVDSIDLTEEELIECIKNKNYEAIIMSFAKVVSKYTKGYDDDLRQELYVALIAKCESKNILNWKNYLYGFIKRHANSLIKYKYKYGNLSKRETDRYLKLYHKLEKTYAEELEFSDLEKKWNRSLPIHHVETMENITNICGNTYEMEFRDCNLIDEIKKILNDVEFSIFYMSSVMDKPLREIASNVHMSHENVSLIIKKCKEKLKNSKNIQQFIE